VSITKPQTMTIFSGVINDEYVCGPHDTFGSPRLDALLTHSKSSPIVDSNIVVLIDGNCWYNRRYRELACYYGLHVIDCSGGLSFVEVEWLVRRRHEPLSIPLRDMTPMYVDDHFTEITNSVYQDPYNDEYCYITSDTPRPGATTVIDIFRDNDMAHVHVACNDMGTVIYSRKVDTASPLSVVVGEYIDDDEYTGYKEIYGDAMGRHRCGPCVHFEWGTNHISGLVLIGDGVVDSVYELTKAALKVYYCQPWTGVRLRFTRDLVCWDVHEFGTMDKCMTMCDYIDLGTSTHLDIYMDIVRGGNPRHFLVDDDVGNGPVVDSTVTPLTSVTYQADDVLQVEFAWRSGLVPIVPASIKTTVAKLALTQAVTTFIYQDMTTGVVVDTARVDYLDVSFTGHNVVSYSVQGDTVVAKVDYSFKDKTPKCII
jgi:hypothetical protein